MKFTSGDDHEIEMIVEKNETKIYYNSNLLTTIDNCVQNEAMDALVYNLCRSEELSLKDLTKYEKDELLNLFKLLRQ